MRFQIVDLERDWWGKIEDFSIVRNRFLDTLNDEDYILWKSRDEELSETLLEYIRGLEPEYPYYWIRRFNLEDGCYAEWANPEYSPHLVSKRVRYHGRVHEHVKPKNPHGVIDIPIVHNHTGPRPYDGGWKATSAYRPILAFKKSLDVMRGR